MEELVALFAGAEMEGALQEIEDELLADLARVSRASSAGDCQAARLAAHRILGGAELVGANQLADAARALELAALSGEPAALGPALGRLRRAWVAAQSLFSFDPAA
jgi:two-component system sensor histidine kinase EvgS